MKKLSNLLVMAGAAALLFTLAGNARAQQRPGGGNFDPEQFRQRMMETLRERFEVKEDDAWKLISVRLEKIMELRRDAGGGFGGFRGRPPGGDGKQGDGKQAEGNDAGRRSRGGFGGQPNPDVEALQKALEAKASPEELKAKMEKLRASRKAKETELEKAQDELRQILTVRQEAVALTMGFLK